jgi:RNA polymerase sigma-70 factor, ECF subfamily
MNVTPMVLSSALERSTPEAEPETAGPAGVAPAAFAAIYDQHVAFVWRSLRRLGVPPSAVDDAVQEVFLVVHCRIGDFEHRSSLKTWIFGIALHVARAQRRRTQRRQTEQLPDDVPDSKPGPHESTAQAQAVEILYGLLDELEDEKRAVFVLVELEQMKVSEAARALGVNQNTLYSRLRAAREQFEAALSRHRSRDTWRQRWSR